MRDDEPDDDDSDGASLEFRRQIITLAVIVAAYFLLRWLGVIAPAHAPLPW